MSDIVAYGFTKSNYTYYTELIYTNNTDRYRYHDIDNTAVPYDCRAQGRARGCRQHHRQRCAPASHHQNLSAQPSARDARDRSIWEESADPFSAPLLFSRLNFVSYPPLAQPKTTGSRPRHVLYPYRSLSIPLSLVSPPQPTHLYTLTTAQPSPQTCTRPS